jgi:hypothetical protein
MKTITSNQFDLPFNAYAAFDATSLKSLMQQRLTQGGVFTDQIYEGSNFNSLLDIIAYSYHVLLFYLNKTASESMYNQAQLYENMNKIVKALNYNPIGFQTSILNFNATAPSTLTPGIYTIPRYSYFTVNGLNYSFTEDTSFIKTETGTELLTQLGQTALLYQGLFQEYPIYVATGAPYEQFSLAATGPDNNNELVDHTNIHVYVLDESGIWSQWNRVDSLYLEGPTSKSFECRLNENQRYVIKFGNNVSGRQMLPNYLVAVYYLKSDGAPGQVGAGTLDGNTLFIYNTPQFTNIFNNVKNINQSYLTPPQAASLVFSNTNASTDFAQLETAENMRNNAANTFKTQYRLITTSDFELFIKNKYDNLVNDVAVVNNWDYVANHMRYYYNIGLKSPNSDSRVLLNQVNFSDSCDFNNIYVYIVPKLQKTNSVQINNNFLATGLKDYIIRGLQNVKMATSEVVIMDPVYTAFGLGVATGAEINDKQLTPDIIAGTKLVVTRNPNSRFSEDELKRQIYKIIKDYFDPQNVTLGQLISLDQLTTTILDLDGTVSMYCSRTVDGQEIIRNGLSFLVFNPVYSDPGEDIQIITQSLPLPYFKVPYLYNVDNLLDQIQIITPDLQAASVREY